MRAISKQQRHRSVSLTHCEDSTKQFHLRYVSISVQTKHLWSVSVGQSTDVLHVLRHLVTFRNHVTFVEVEVWREHVLPKPHLAEGEEQTFVKVVCNTAAILDFTQHVSHTCPADSLNREKYFTVKIPKQDWTENSMLPLFD